MVPELLSVHDQPLNFFAPVPGFGIRRDPVKIENQMICASLFDSYTKSLTGAGVGRAK